jgi:hypothetical protein
MENLKSYLKQHFVSAYVNRHLSDRAGYPEEWNIENLILGGSSVIGPVFFEELNTRKLYDLKMRPNRVPIFSSTSNDGINWTDSFNDTFKHLQVIHWFEAQGTLKHLSIAKRLREIAGIVGEIHDEIIIKK